MNKEVDNEVKYTVALDLTPEEKNELKIAAIHLGVTIKELVKRAIEHYLQVKAEIK